MKRAWRNAATLCGLAVCLHTGASAVPSYGDCVPVVIGLDPSQANGSSGAVLGHGVGQTFAARDTLIHSLTVWRVEPTSTIGVHLYIVGTDSTGRPDATKILQDGPTLNIYGDGTYPVEFKWTFDPPVVLPSRGEYAFFLFQDPCAIYFDILATTPSLYPEGQVWGTGRSDCVINGDLHTNPAGDDIFQIEFCRDAATPARKASWGILKTIYR
jgi:hypothetical protein